MIITIICFALIWLVLGLITNFISGFVVGEAQFVGGALGDWIVVLIWPVVAPRTFGSAGALIRRKLKI